MVVKKLKVLRRVTNGNVLLIIFPTSNFLVKREKNDDKNDESNDIPPPPKLIKNEENIDAINENNDNLHWLINSERSTRNEAIATLKLYPLFYSYGEFLRVFDFMTAAINNATCVEINSRTACIQHALNVIVGGTGYEAVNSGESFEKIVESVIENEIDGILVHAFVPNEECVDCDDSAQLATLRFVWEALKNILDYTKNKLRKRAAGVLSLRV